MRKTFFARPFTFILLFILTASTIFGQKPKPIVFAVLNNGTTLEPIAMIEKGKLVPASDGGDEEKDKVKFVKTYYKPKTSYSLIFGGASGGLVTIKSADPTSECASNLAEVTTKAKTAKLSGFVMALATNVPPPTAKSTRRQPTPAERAEITTLVRNAFLKQKVAADDLKTLKFHNMTALDVEADGKAEIVGSAYVETSKTSRAVLFFIADKDKAGKYAFGFSDYRAINQDEVMSGEIGAVDTGIYCELLLDVMEYNGDKTGEIFTYMQGFEGNGFNAYRRSGNKWVRAYEGSNYHCGF